MNLRMEMKWQLLWIKLILNHRNVNFVLFFGFFPLFWMIFQFSIISKHKIQLAMKKVITIKFMLRINTTCELWAIKNKQIGTIKIILNFSTNSRFLQNKTYPIKAESVQCETVGHYSKWHTAVYRVEMKVNKKKLLFELTNKIQII